ncbi:hypothetical protein JXA32_02995, partial [Candidatus Sumerlaeota bacterium]|nr:hypothetical protein [Candidatus Sumerlaeota bacterium]
MKRAVWMFAALTAMCGGAFGAEYSTATLTSRAVSVLCLDSDRDGTSVTLTESLAGMIPGTLQQVTQTGATTDRTVSVGGLTVNGNTFTGR